MIENALLRELAVCWRITNQETFRGMLKMPSLQLHDGMSRYGFWRRRERLLSISRDFVMTSAWNKVLTVLKHEMVHQYVSEILYMDDENPHGPVFQSMCELFHVESHAEADMLENGSRPPAMILERIQKLLSLAGSSNIHEAESAMNKANTLLLKWNISALEEERQRLFIHRNLGTPGRIDIINRILSQIIRDFFFVEILWVSSYDANADRKGRVMEICGTRENVDIAEYAHAFLLNTTESYWRSYKIANPHARRKDYVYGILLGFYEKLKQQQSSSHTEQGLVWLGDPHLKAYFDRRHPRVRQVRSSSSSFNEDSLNDGIAQGHKVVLARGLEKTAARNFLLTGG